MRWVRNLYTCCDLSSGFYQLSITPSDRPKTAFLAPPLGLLEFKRLAMGLSNAPNLFQRVMERFKQELSSAFLIYLDDIILGSYDEPSHLLDIENFLKAIIRNGMKLKMEKCVFGRTEVKYLGFLLSGKGIRPDPKNLQAVANFGKPNTLKELRSLIGCLSYFRKFCSKFAEDIAPLNELTAGEGYRPEQWEEKHQLALDTLKKRLMEAPVLAPPRFGHPFIIETDASLIAIGACLLQENKDGEIHPICYASRKLRKNEMKFSTLELEALGISFAVTQFRPYIEGNGETLVRTDNSGLTTALQSRNISTRLMKFQVHLQAYNLKLVHRSGASNKLCDHLSRWPSDHEPTVNSILGLPEEDPLPDFGQDLINHFEGDTLLQEVKSLVTQNWPEEIDHNNPLHPFFEVRSDLSIKGPLVSFKVVEYGLLTGSESEDFHGTALGVGGDHPVGF